MSGPDAGATWSIGPGRHLVGRAINATIRADDPALEPYHAAIEVGADGSATLLQLAGRRRIPGHLADAARVELGNSVLECRRSGESRTAVAHVRDGTLLREPRAVPQHDPRPITPPGPAPQPERESGGLTSAFLGLAAAATVAVLLHQPMFLLFGAFGALMAVGAWGAQRIAGWRRARAADLRYITSTDRFTEDLLAQRDRALAHHVAVTTTAATARSAITGCTTALWSRRADHGDAYRVAIGTGTFQWIPIVDGQAAPDASWQALEHARSVDHQPVAVDLDPGARLAVRGPRDDAMAVARSLVLQLVANCGPADLRLVVVTDEPEAWHWATALPHARSFRGGVAVTPESGAVDELAARSGPRTDSDPVHTVVIADSCGWLAVRTSPLRRAVVAAPAPAVIAIVRPETGIPHLCTAALTIVRGAPSRWVTDTRDGTLPQPVAIAGVSLRSATRLATNLSVLRDPEDATAADDALPDEVELADLLLPGRPLTGASIAAGWHAAGADARPCSPIGIADGETIDLDLVRDGPHGLLAGTTGAGKSELLRSLVIGLAVTCSPRQLSFVLVDYKGGATFDVCAPLPHVVGMVTDLDGRLADRALRSLNAELRRREQILREHGVPDLPTLHRTHTDVVLPRLVVVVDEFAALVQEQSAFLHALVGIAQRGRSLGLHLLLATQRPQGVISDDIRANTNLRLALRVQDATDAVDVIGDVAPARLPRSRPGRAVLRLADDDLVTFQTARCADPQAVVQSVREANRLLDLEPPQRPWQPPLPRETTHRPGAVGIIDDPDRQRTEPLRWNHDRGHLVLAGSKGSGLTTALASLGADALARDEEVELYIVDAFGSPLLDTFARHPRCGGVVRLHDRERVLRLLHRLATEVEARSRRGHPPSGTTHVPRVVVLVDGLGELRRALDDLHAQEQLDAFERMVNRGPSVGIVGAFTTVRAAGTPAVLLAQSAQRWVLHLADADDAGAFGVRSTAVAPPVPGRLVIAECGREAQLSKPPDVLDATAERRVEPLRCLPSSVAGTELPRSERVDGACRLAVGLRFGDLQPALLEVHDGEHVMVLGPARSGRTTALRRVISAWCDGNPDGWVGTLHPRPGRAELPHSFADLETLLARLPARGQALVVIDDAELLDDPAGALGALAASRRPGLCITAAGRPDTLRTAYGHWSATIRRGAVALVMASCSDLDGELVGTVLPRRAPIASRPGLAWSTAGGETALVQLAIDRPEPTARRPPRDALALA